jgi:hypothetical protein
MRTSTHSPAAVQALEQAISMLAELQLTVDSTRSSMSSVALPVQDKGGVLLTALWRAINANVSRPTVAQPIMKNVAKEHVPRSTTWLTILKMMLVLLL